ncbi:MULTISPECIES: carbohydrate porin [unclassified Methylobacterium]|uniref:carbohydrate porin n=1 Tax=unclassified Methylobacterium TaxID=2615210 RepID=UPI0006F25059|nr:MULTISPECIES: carbohydrate porin [unclassified Methylobacterium]KQO59126.1 porin [Methylobacterium sp. Leaf86]KQO85346.1 porin [Methylobacterium sp. Leaf91]
MTDFANSPSHSRRLQSALLGTCLACTLPLGLTGAWAQSPSAIETFTGEAGPRTDPSAIGVAPDGTEKWHGPLAPYAASLAAHGLSFDVNAYEYFFSNPSAGLRPGQLSNSTYYLLSLDADLDRIAGIKGGWFHYTQTFFGLRWNNRNMGGDIGDTTIGYQPTFNRDFARLSVLTYEQRLFDDRLAIEVGRTHPNRYYALPPCQSSVSCFQDILQINAGLSSPLYGVWGGNVAYKLSAQDYVQAGAFAVTSGANFLSGYDWNYEPLTGALVLAEAGHATTFVTDPYPSRVALTGFYNTADHADNFKTVFGTSKGLDPGAPVLQKSGTSGVILTASQVVWRADGGADAANLNPTSIQAYTSLAYAPDPTIPIRWNAFAGVTLQAPDQSRPFDRYGVKVNWQRIAGDYAQFLSDANFISGGTGAPYSRDKLVFEANAHLALGQGIFFEPVIQYLVNGNSYWNPYTANRSKDGFYVGATLIVPLGAIFGLSPG